MNSIEQRQNKQFAPWAAAAAAVLAPSQNWCPGLVPPSHSTLVTTITEYVHTDIFHKLPQAPKYFFHFSQMETTFHWNIKR